MTQLPDHKLEEVSDFIEFLLYKWEDTKLSKGINDLQSKSAAFQFLEEEEELYDINDLKEKYE